MSGPACFRVKGPQQPWRLAACGLDKGVEGEGWKTESLAADLVLGNLKDLNWQPLEAVNVACSVVSSFAPMNLRLTKRRRGRNSPASRRPHLLFYSGSGRIDGSYPKAEGICASIYVCVLSKRNALWKR